MREYKHLDTIPTGHASDVLTNGCLVLEGGAFRGLYTMGVLDYFMLHDLNMQTTIGTSAGALCGFNYVAGQIGRAAIVNLKHRHDSNYVGARAFLEDGGIMGFTYLFNELSNEIPFDEEAFNNPARRFIATTTNVETGKTEYFEKGKTDDIFKAIQASATVPYISRPVIINDTPYLDGGIATKIPLDWVLEENFDKIVIVRTRDKSYRKEVRSPLEIARRAYKDYPEFKLALVDEAPRYNVLLDRIDLLEQQGRLFVLAPSVPVEISRFEGNLDNLGDLYQLGMKDAEENFEKILAYLKK